MSVRSTSSARCAIATAGTPERANPASARKATRTVQFGAKAASTVAPAAEAMETVITRLRPNRSESAPAPNIASRHHARRRRERQARRGRRQPKSLCEGGHQRLHAVEHRKGAEPRDEHGDVDAAETGLPARDQGRPRYGLGRPRGFGRSSHDGKELCAQNPARQVISSRRRGVTPSPSPPAPVRAERTRRGKRQSKGC